MVHPKPWIALMRNTHGVPLERIEHMIADWEPAQHCVAQARALHTTLGQALTQHFGKAYLSYLAFAFVSGILLVGAILGGLLGAAIVGHP
jgi:hypothetical protein